VLVAYLGRADDLLRRLQSEESVRVRSFSHGAVAALWHLAAELDVAATIDRHLALSGRRSRPGRRDGLEPLPPRMHDGLSVGQSLTLVAIGRACQATSKRGFSDWAKTTTLGELANVRDIEKLDSQHFWDQMEQVPVEQVPAIEAEIVQRAVEQFSLPVDTILYDGTNFFTFIASTNEHTDLARRGKNKQKRNDLRQVSVAMLCTRQHGIPLWHQTYEGQVADAKSFHDFFPAICQRLTALKSGLDALTVVYDKGNVSRANQARVDASNLHYVTGLTVASQEKLVEKANKRLAPIELNDGETVLAHRLESEIWDKTRTVVVLVSDRLREGQIQGILQHVKSAQEWFSDLAATLARGKQKRSRSRIAYDIENRLRGRQHLSKVLSYELTGEDPHLKLSFEFNQTALDQLAEETLGRLVLITSRHNWTTADIIECYRSQAAVEALFAHLKDPVHIALRPQFHWTDQKLHIHVLTCVLSHLLARLLYLKATRIGTDLKSQEALLAALQQVRRTVLARSSGSKPKLRVTTQLEDIDASIENIVQELGVQS
jgi:transposase